MYKYVLLLTAVLIVLLSREVQLSSNGLLQWHVPYVGQGDAMLLTTPKGAQIIIDGGPNLDLLTVLGKHMPWFDRTIELLILTHPDSDHITALPEVLKRYRVEKIIMTGTQHSSGRYAAFIEQIKQQNIQLISPCFGTVIHSNDGIELQILWPIIPKVGEKVPDANHESVVLRVVYGNESILLTGDIEAEAEQEILASGQIIQSTYLKIAHHGSKTSTTTEFLRAVQPNYAIISSGINNRFNHPHANIVQKLTNAHIPIWNTAKQGDFSLELSGKNPYNNHK